MAYDKPLPNPTALSAPFWEGTKRRELLVQKCTACGALRWTPQWPAATATPPSTTGSR